MAFPENETRPSRTIVASPFPRSREALLYRSEWKRIGNGQYRGPTVREAASLMSFPITYQFLGNLGAKWKLVGNAVCPLVARALAIHVCKSFGIRHYSLWRPLAKETTTPVPNLNTFAATTYSCPPVRMHMARFRSHIIKSGGTTIALANYNLTKRKSKADGKWRCFVTQGIGKGFKVRQIIPSRMQRIQQFVEALPSGTKYVEEIKNGFSTHIPSALVLQRLYETNAEAEGDRLAPARLLERARNVVYSHSSIDELVKSPPYTFHRDVVPKSQVFALFAVCHIASMANGVKERA